MFVVNVFSLGEPLLFSFLTVDERTDLSILSLWSLRSLKVFALYLRVKSSGKAAQIQSRRAHTYTPAIEETNTR